MEKFFRSAHPQSDATEAKWFWLNIFVNEKYFKLDHQSILKYINIPAHIHLIPIGAVEAFTP